MPGWPRRWRGCSAAASSWRRRSRATAELLPGLLASGDLARSYDDREFRERLARVLPADADEARLAAELRRLRRREMVRIVWRDLLRAADLVETTRDLTLAGRGHGRGGRGARPRPARGAPRRTARTRLRCAAAPGGARHGQARRLRAEPLLRHRPDLRLPRAGRDRRRARAQQPGVLHAARAARDQGHRRQDPGRFRVPRRHAPAPLRRRGRARAQLRRDGGVLPGPGPRLGALRDDQGARDRGRSRCRRAAARGAAPVHLPPLHRLQRHRVAARHEGDDQPRGAAPRQDHRREARRRRHPRDRVHRAVLPADPRRPRDRAAGAPPAGGAGAARPPGPLARRGGGASSARPTCSCATPSTRSRPAPTSRRRPCPRARTTGCGWPSRWASPTGTPSRPSWSATALTCGAISPTWSPRPTSSRGTGRARCLARAVGDGEGARAAAGAARGGGLRGSGGHAQAARRAAQFQPPAGAADRGPRAARPLHAAAAGGGRGHAAPVRGDRPHHAAGGVGAAPQRLPGAAGREPRRAGAAGDGCAARARGSRRSWRTTRCCSTS